MYHLLGSFQKVFSKVFELKASTEVVQPKRFRMGVRSCRQQVHCRGPEQVTVRNSTKHSENNSPWLYHAYKGPKVFTIMFVWTQLAFTLAVWKLLSSVMNGRCQHQVGHHYDNLTECFNDVQTQTDWQHVDNDQIMINNVY